MCIENIFVINEYKNASFLIKRNLRSKGNKDYIDLALNNDTIKEEIRKGKNVYYHEKNIVLERTVNNTSKTISTRQVTRLITRTIDNKGQDLLFPEYEIAVWYTDIDSKFNAKQVVDLYKDHGTSEQFHSELKTDMDIERLPSSKFTANTLILNMAMIAFNILRLVGQEMIKSGFHNRKRKVKRLRLRKVIQDIMYMAGKFVIKHKLPTLKLPKINIFRDAFEFVFKKLQLE